MPKDTYYLLQIWFRRSFWKKLYQKKLYWLFFFFKVLSKHFQHFLYFLYSEGHIIVQSIWNWKLFFRGKQVLQIKLIWHNFFLEVQIWLIPASLSVINLLKIFSFSCKNYCSCLTSSSKCRGNVRCDIKYWCPGNNTGRHCLLLKFYLNY